MKPKFKVGDKVQVKCEKERVVKGVVEKVVLTGLDPSESLYQVKIEPVDDLVKVYYPVELEVIDDEPTQLKLKSKFKVGDWVQVPCPLAPTVYHDAVIVQVTTIEGTTPFYKVRLSSGVELFFPESGMYND